ncbi:hypothetical protein EIP86_004997 [Pleurotus ostreatoroseus]|nr:hypothetical protein EIP86_004997 [Pleurotus ostreatoroseus]
MGGAVCRTKLCLQDDADSAIAPQYLVDINGAHISTNKWYKIVLRDGNELGWGVVDQGRDGCAPVPAGHGFVIRYRRDQVEDKDHPVYGWPAGDKGWLKGYTMMTNGNKAFRHLSLSMDAPPILAWYDSNDSYGFVAKQLPGYRVALYAYDKNHEVAGLKAQNMEGGQLIQGTQGAYPIALDCAFVEVGPFDENNMYF